MLSVTSISTPISANDARLCHKTVDYVDIGPEDARRRRFRARSTSGKELFIALARDVEILEGAVLHESENEVMIARLRTYERLVMKPMTRRAALQLGFLAGHLHWKTEIGDDRIYVQIEASVDEYQSRILEYLDVKDFVLTLESETSS